LMDIKIDSQKFNNIKEAMLRGLKNRKLGQAYSRGGYYNWLMLLDEQYTEEQKLEALLPLSLDDVKAYAKILYEKVFVTGMIHGNYTDEKAIENTNILINSLKSQPLAQVDRYEQIVEKMPKGKRFRFSREVKDNNNSLAYAIQVGDKDPALLAQVSMLASIVESNFYTQMRTNQQLGYIVWSFQQRMEDRIFFRLLIQSSTHGPFEMSKRVNAWLKSTDKLFAELNDQEFERHRKALIVDLEKEGDSIGAVLSDLYTFAVDEKGDFNYKKNLIQAVKEVKKNDVISRARKVFLDPETPRLEVLMRANGSKEKVPTGIFNEVSQFKNSLRARN